MGDIGKAINVFLLVLFLFGIAFGIGVAYGVPWIWLIVKPLIHAGTA